MNNKIIKTLEFDKIINLLIDNCQTEIGKNYIESLKISNDLDKINRWLDETLESSSLIYSKSIPLISNIKDMKKDFELLKLGRFLSLKKILEVSTILNTSKYIFDFFNNNDSEKYPIIFELISLLIINTTLEKKIKATIKSENELFDDASPELFKIRKRILLKNEMIKEKLNSIVSNSDKLMEKIYTLRDGRYVVPVKSEFKNSFKGIIHDQSSSGQTVYIEPISVIELNNELRKLEIDENREIENIMIDLSNKIFENLEDILINLEIIAKFDFIISKGIISNLYNCNKPTINKNGKIILNSARHPLISAEKVVPIDIQLGTDFNTLVITGPNTGGKTVTLKTVGLLTLMVQYGLLIPVNEKSEIAIFDEIFADIGDEQSIEQSLSTFSSHMKNIINIINLAKDNSLLLFDELGSGTDPEEGSALSISILNYFLEKKIRTIATTHYSQLKIYAMSTENVKNAAVEFDVDKLEPTYKIIIGVSGKSNAFDISKKLGLDEYFISNAKNYISTQSISFDNLIGHVDDTRKEYEKLLNHQKKITDDLNKLKEEYQLKIDKYNLLKDKKIKNLHNYIENKVYETDKFYKESIKEINKAKTKLNSEKLKKLSTNIQKNIESLNKNKIKKINNSKNLENLILGEEVKILSLNENGYIQTLPDKNGNLQIKVGILKINSNISDIIRIENIIDNSKDKNIKISKSFISENKIYNNKIDIRGLNSEDAIIEIDKFIDNSFIVNLGEITIIHGKGTGVLRNAVKDFLRTHKLVKSFEYGKFNEGGDGATVVKLK